METTFPMNCSCTAQKSLHLCRADAFENPQCNLGASCPVFGSHYKVGLQAPSEILAPAGTPSVRQKCRLVTNTAEVLRSRCRLRVSTLARDRAVFKSAPTEPRRKSSNTRPDYSL